MCAALSRKRIARDARLNQAEKAKFLSIRIEGGISIARWPFQNQILVLVTVVISYLRAFDRDNISIYVEWRTRSNSDGR